MFDELDSFNIDRDDFKSPFKVEAKEGKTYWDCFTCDGHGMIIKDNKLVECNVCEGIGSCS